MTDTEWISASQAIARLGIRAQTLYAYVSRGHIEVRPEPGNSRRSQYRAADVDTLATRRKRSRKHADVASAAIAWGEPVLASAITTIQSGRLYYRGQDAVDLSHDQPFEAVARLLRDDTGRAADAIERPLPPTAATAGQRLFLALAQRAGEARAMLGTSEAFLFPEAEAMMTIITDAVTGTHGTGPIHARLARHWGAASAGQTADIIRRMLVLLADHELNASTFATRVTASTGASLAACVLAGLAALTGPRHGGHSAMVQRFAAEAARYGTHEAIGHRLAEGRHLPGFGHPLYPDGDVRAKALLAAMDMPAPHAELAKAVRDSTGGHPNIDFAMVAACAACHLPDHAPFAIFATARCSGWIAHALEQRQSDHLIRPRARYNGVDPGRSGMAPGR
jgi:citrate synthase